MPNFKHKIDLIPSDTLVCIPPYQLSRLVEDEFATHNKDYLRLGHIQHSKALWGALVILVKKMDRTWRICVNYRCLNKVTFEKFIPFGTS